ncbi:UNVERIFIED_CONTAM: hypothetical protein Sradi_1694300 [Sesamum radiatum]|uniref:Uncharacterized protein n=1 Tax=Sesamum radiatum TaxID=300843 RepID=A0AAW2TT28_SESRA
MSWFGFFDTGRGSFRNILRLFCGGPSRLSRVEGWELGWVVDKRSHVNRRVVDGNQADGVGRLGE